MDRQSFTSRLIIAAFIILIGWIMYMSQVEKNPVTGEKQHVSLTTDQEIRLGLESAPAMSREMGGELSSNDPRTQEVLSMGKYLLDNSLAKKSPWKFQFHLLADNRTVNAFALPGGQIFITLGLYDKLQNGSQLAGVLGHEMGHVIERHTAEQMAKSQLGQAFLMAVGTAATDPSNPSGSQAPAVIASLVNQMVQLRYGRKDESEADIWGLKIMSEAGFDPWSMIQVMEILKAAGGQAGHAPEIFQSHPNPDLRIAQIKEYLAKNPPSPDLRKGSSLNKTAGYQEDGQLDQSTLLNELLRVLQP